MMAFMTTTYETNTEDLIALIAAYKTVEEVEANDYTFDHDTVPALGDIVVGFSRGKYRRGRVVKVTKTNTVTIAYVTEGGVAEAQRIIDIYRDADPQRSYDRSKNHDLKQRAEYQAVVDGEQAPLGLLTVERYVEFLTNLTDEKIERYAENERQRTAKNKALVLTDLVNVTQKALKAKDGRVSVAVSR